MKEYELTVLIHPDLEVDIETPLAKVRNLITSVGGSIVSEENWGKRRLAYDIKNQGFAIYVYFDVSLPSDAPLKISNTLNITDDILRYLLVTVNEKGRRALAEAKINEANSSANERE